MGCTNSKNDVVISDTIPTEVSTIEEIPPGGISKAQKKVYYYILDLPLQGYLLNRC